MDTEIIRLFLNLFLFRLLDLVLRPLILLVIDSKIESIAERCFSFRGKSDFSWWQVNLGSLTQALSSLRLLLIVIYHLIKPPLSIIHWRSKLILVMSNLAHLFDGNVHQLLDLLKQVFINFIELLDLRL